MSLLQVQKLFPGSDFAQQHENETKRIQHLSEERLREASAAAAADLVAAVTRRRLRSKQRDPNPHPPKRLRVLALPSEADLDALPPKR